jgi:hypothetical protein
VSSQCDPDQAYCQKAAQAIFACYRRDEAHNPEGYAAALGAVLSDYSRQVVDYVADPRTGVSTEFPMGLPNVGQIRDLCDSVARRMELLAKPQAIAVQYEPPPLEIGQIDSMEFARRVAAHELSPRPIGRFERPDDEWNRHRTGGQAWD